MIEKIELKKPSFADKSMFHHFFYLIPREQLLFQMSVITKIQNTEM